jgi:WD40 repeat protein/serine/threonine protein kinase
MIVNGICEKATRLGDLLAGKLAPSDREALRTHVESCSFCQARLEEMVTAEEHELRWPDKIASTNLSEEDVLRELSAHAPLDFASGSFPRVTITQPSSASPATPLREVPGYEILGELGRGGMGIVYKARQIGANRVVALKVILSGGHARPEDVLRFRREAEAPARLRHPNIVQIYEAGEHGGLPYFSMEYAEGGNLAQYLKGTTLPPREAAAVTIPLAEAVHYAHAAGVVHRDLKPANILLSGTWRVASEVGPGIVADGPRAPGETIDTSQTQSFRPASRPPSPATTPKIADFGLAQMLNDPGHTRTGAVLGTPSYMAPEQTRSAKVGPPADIYALGAVLYEMVTGRPPFLAETWSDTFRQLQQEDPVPPRRLQPTIPRDLETICLKCLEKEPARRYRSALELSADLQRYLDDLPIQARSASKLYQWSKFARRNKALVGGVVGVGIALFLGATVSFLFALGEASQRRQADANAAEREEARLLALSEAYQARVLAAQASLLEHDPVQAGRHLDAAPAAFRGWEWHHFKSRLDESSRTIENQPNSHWTAVVYDRSGWRGLSQGPDGLALWDLLLGRRLALLSKETDLSVAAGSTAGGFRCLVTGAGRRPRLLDEKGAILATLEEPGIANLADFSHDGSLVALIHELSTQAIHVYDTRSGKRIGVWNGNGLSRSCLGFSPDGTILASGDVGGFVVLWNPQTHKELGRFKAHPGFVRATRFREDGKRLMTSGDDQTLRQWDVPSCQAADVRYMATLATAAIYSPDGHWIATAGVDHSIRIWPAEGGEMVGAWHGHKGLVDALVYSPDGTELASLGKDGVRMWHVAAGSGPGVLRGHENYVYPVACSPDSRLIASGGWDDAIRLWNAHSGAAVAMLTGHGAWIADLAFTPDGKKLCSLANDGTLRIWDVTDRRLLRTLRQNTIVSPALVHKIAIHPNGRLVAAGGGGKVQFWDLASGNELANLELPARAIRVVRFSPNGRLLAAVEDDVRGTGNSAVAIIDFGSRKVLTELPGKHPLIHAVAFNPDGKTIATGGEDRAVRIWSVETGEQLRQLDGHFHDVFAAAYSPDGTRLATAGRDRIIRLWNPTTGDQMAQLRGHTDYVFSLAFTPDGATLVSGSGDTTVRLWRTAPSSDSERAR